MTAIGQIGPWQLLLVLALILLFFGSSRLPKMARSLGQSLTEFKKGLRGEDDKDKKKVEPTSGSDDGDDDSDDAKSD